MVVNLPLFIYTKAESIVLCPNFSSMPRTGRFTPRKSPGLEDNKHYYQNNPRMRWSTNIKRVKQNGIHTEVK